MTDEDIQWMSEQVVDRWDERKSREINIGYYIEESLRGIEAMRDYQAAMRKKSTRYERAVGLFNQEAETVVLSGEEQDALVDALSKQPIYTHYRTADRFFYYLHAERVGDKLQVKLC